MKTKLPDAINTIDEAKQFLTDLHNNGEAFHPEDNAHDIIWNGMNVSNVPTPAECDQLNKLMNDIYNLPGNDGDHANPEFDPCGFSFHSSMRDAKKAMNEFKKNSQSKGFDDFNPDSEIEMIEVIPTKSGIIEALNIHAGHNDNG